MIKAVATAVETAERAAGQAPVQSLYLEALTLVERLHWGLPRSAVSGFHRRRNGFDHNTSPVVVFIDLFDETCVPPDSCNLRGSFEDPLK